MQGRLAEETQLAISEAYSPSDTQDDGRVADLAKTVKKQKKSAERLSVRQLLVGVDNQQPNTRPFGDFYMQEIVCAEDSDCEHEA